MGLAAQFFFVWVRGLRGPEAQKWAELDFSVGNRQKERVLASRILSLEESKLGIDELERVYPPPNASEPT